MRALELLVQGLHFGVNDYPRCAANVLVAEFCRCRHRDHLCAAWHLAARFQECAQRVYTPLAWRAAWASRAPIGPHRLFCVAASE